MRKKLQFFVLCTMLFLAIGALAPITTILFSQGCPPNDTCPQGWEPVSFSCWLVQCDGPGGEGYCIFCKKAKAV